LEKIETYNEATAEQTEKNTIAYQNQAKYVAEFDKMAKDGKKSLSKIHVIEKAEQFESVEAEMVKIPILPNND
jgi:PPE-repeat protein